MNHPKRPRLPANRRRLLVASLGVASATYLTSSCTGVETAGNFMSGPGDEFPPQDSATYSNDAGGLLTHASDAEAGADADADAGADADAEAEAAADASDG